MVQEIVRFTKVDTAFAYIRPLRYCAMFDSHAASLPYVARFHAKKVLKFTDAILTSYHRNEVILFPSLTRLLLVTVLEHLVFNIGSILCKEKSNLVVNVFPFSG